MWRPVGNRCTGGRNTEGGGQPASEGQQRFRGRQGTEFNRSFRKLSGSVISDSRPGNKRQRLLGAGTHGPQPVSHGCRILEVNTLYSNKF